MASPDFFSQLPSLDELLEHPRVKSAVDRVTRSAAAERVRTAIGALAAEAGRAAEGLHGIAPTEILDRLVQRLYQRTPAPPTRSINATGDPLARGWALPLAGVAAEALGTVALSGAGPGADAAASALRALVGAEAAVALVSHAVALQAVLEAGAAGGVVVVARGDMTELAPGVRLDGLARRAGVTLAEVGATDSASVADYAAGLAGAHPRPVAILRRAAVPGADLAGLARLAKEHGAAFLVDLGRGRPTDATPTYSEAPSPTAEGALRAGATLVTLDGAGLVGGPMSGVVAGERSPVAKASDVAVTLGARLAAPLDAALAATLDLFASPDSLRFSHPLHQLLDAPLDNLRTRAERLAPQLAGAAGIVAAEAVPVGGTSWGVRLHAAPGGGAALAARFATPRSGVLGPGVVGTAEPDGVLLDLRSVFPRDDAALAAAIAPPAKAAGA